MRLLLTPMPAISGLDMGWANTTVPVSSAGGPATSGPNPAIEIARLQALVGTLKRSVVTVILEEEAVVGALGAVRTKGDVMSGMNGVAKYLTGGS